MSETGKANAADERCEELFEALVESVGIKTFASNLGLSTRQIHRMRNGAKPNPLRRFCEMLQACDLKSAEGVLSYVCRQMGVYWIRVPADVKTANVNAVREAAEAIVAISEDRPTRAAVREIREAISALASLEKVLDARAELTKAAKKH